MVLITVSVWKTTKWYEKTFFRLQDIGRYNANIEEIIKKTMPFQVFYEKLIKEIVFIIKNELFNKNDEDHNLSCWNLYWINNYSIEDKSRYDKLS